MKLSDVPPHITEMPNHPPYFWTAYKTAYGEWPQQEEIIPLWHLDYYDGPLSGVVECKGRHFYVRHVYYDDRKWWVAWELTPDEWARELARHEAFEKYVGTHTSYKQNAEGEWNREHAVKPEAEWRKFYDDKEMPKVDHQKEVETRDIFGLLMNPFRSW